MDKHGVGVGFSDKGGEFAVKGCVFGKSSEKKLNKVTYKTPKPFRGWIELDAKTVKDAGVLYHAQSLHINAEIEIHGIVMHEENEGDIRSLFEAGVKFGIKSNLGSIADSTASIAKGDINRPEGLINTAFQSYKLYVEALKLLSPGHGLSGGSWFYMHAGETTKDKKAAHPVPTIIDVLDLKSKSSELQLLGTQVKAYRGYIEAKYMKGDAAKNSASSNMSSSSLDIEIPIAATVPTNIQVAIQKATEKSELYLNTNIYVSDRLTIKIAGRADLKGVSISAGKLEASFNELVLESLQNVIESGGFGSSLGGGIGKEGGLDSLNIGNHIQDRSRHVVESLTMLLGRESVHIVVAEALRMNGALIANADRDSDGKFTDHGNLALKVGELFVQHIYDYDKGLTLGAALSYTGSTKYGQPYIDAMPTFGSFNKDGITRSTIGKGNAQVGSCNLDDVYGCSADSGASTLNRDVRKTQEFNTNYSIEPITAYFTTIDTDLLKKKFPRDKDGNIDLGEVARGFFGTALNELKRPFESNSSSKAPDKKPEEKASKDKDEAQGKKESKKEKVKKTESKPEESEPKVKVKVEGPKEGVVKVEILPDGIVNTADFISCEFQYDANGNVKVKLDETSMQKLVESRLETMKTFADSLMTAITTAVEQGMAEVLKHAGVSRAMQIAHGVKIHAMTFPIDYARYFQDAKAQYGENVAKAHVVATAQTVIGGIFGGLGFLAGSRAGPGAAYAGAVGVTIAYDQSGGAEFIGEAAAKVYDTPKKVVEKLTEAARILGEAMQQDLP